MPRPGANIVRGPYLATLVGFLALALLSPLTLTAQTLEREIAAARSQLEEARASHLDLIAPRHFDRAAANLRDAERQLEKGGEVATISGKLEVFRSELDECEKFGEIGEVLLRDALATRAEALAADAPALVPALWAQAEEAAKRAGRKIEAGDQNGARKEAAKATKLYGDAELMAIRTELLGGAQAMRDEALRLQADRLAPATFIKAENYLEAAEQVVRDDRYNRDDAAEMAEQASEEYRHAARIAGEIERLNSDKTIGIESLVLTHEAELAGIAEQLGLEPGFAGGTAPVAEQIAAAIDSLQGGRDDLQAELAAGQAELEVLEARLAALEERDAQLREREKRERTIQKVQAMFGPAEAEVLIARGQLVLRLLGLSFASGSEEIRPEYFSLLTKVQSALREFPKVPITVEGHTDSQGNDDYNRQLSQRRANAVREYLLANMGLEPDWIIAVGFGASRPIANNATEEGRAKNRRIDVVIELIGS